MSQKLISDITVVKLKLHACGGENPVAAMEGAPTSFILLKKETELATMEDESGAAIVVMQFFFFFDGVLIVMVIQTFNKSPTDLTNIR